MKMNAMATKPDMPDVFVVLVTTPTDKEARLIGRKLIDSKLAACVNIISTHSFFYWENAFQETPESLLIIKAKKANLQKLEKRVKELHSYKNPEIIALPVAWGSKGYLDWVRKS